MFLDIRDHFLDERATARAVGRGIGEDVMAGETVGIKHDAEKIARESSSTSGVRHETSPRIVAAESGDYVQSGIFFCVSRFKRPFGRDQGRALTDRPLVKLGQDRAGNVDRLDRVGFLELRLDDHFFDDGKNEICRLARFDFNQRDRAKGVAGTVADLVRVAIESNHGLSAIFADLERRKRTGETGGAVVKSERFARLPVFGVNGEKRLRREPIRPETRLLRARSRREHHVNARIDRRFLNLRGEKDVESRPFLVVGGERSAEARQGDR